MLQRVIAIVVLSLSALATSCDMQRKQVIDQKGKKVEQLVEVGGDIFAAKERLQAQGFEIAYGPDFPTKTEKYLMMVVDYGVQPSGLETFKYTVGLEGSGEPIDGIIKATPDGKITSIE